VLIRRFLFGVACLAFFYLVAPEWALPAGFDYGVIVGDVFVLGFLLVLACRFVQHRRTRREHPERFDGLTWTGRSRHPQDRNKR